MGCLKYGVCFSGVDAGRTGAAAPIERSAASQALGISACHIAENTHIKAHFGPTSVACRAAKKSRVFFCSFSCNFG